MSEQPRFQFARDEVLGTTPIVAYAAPREAQPRLSAQCARILARLRQGPASNRELAAIALKYTGGSATCARPATGSRTSTKTTRPD